MLIDFTVQNYRSFGRSMGLSMQATKLKAQDSEVDDLNVIEAPDLRLLKVAGVYGANASGKSNLILSMQTMRHLILNSAREGQAGDSLPANPFRLQTKWLDRPSFFECTFLSGGTQYRYGFEITGAEVVAEWLHRRPEGSRYEHRLFHRTGREYRFHKDFSEGRRLKRQTRSNALHLSVCAQFDGPISTEVLLWFKKCRVLHGLHSIRGLTAFSRKALGQPELGPGVRELVRRLDVGISELAVHQIELDSLDDGAFADLPDALREQIVTDLTERVRTVHTIRDEDGSPPRSVEFALEEESDGTRKLFALSGAWIDTLRVGAVIVIDELDARLHPFITRELVRLFQSPDTNPKGAQLVFATHDTHLLDRCLLRRDQYWFIEKSRRSGESELYSLAEIQTEDGKVIRADARFEKDYLHGRYGAVPSLGRLHSSVASIVADLSRPSAERS